MKNSLRQSRYVKCNRLLAESSRSKNKSNKLLKSMFLAACKVQRTSNCVNIIGPDPHPHEEKGHFN